MKKFNKIIILSIIFCVIASYSFVFADENTINVTTSENNETVIENQNNTESHQEVVLNDTNTIYYENFSKVKLDSGYSGSKDINKNDPHFGWKLGRFAITGFSNKVKDEDGNWILLKNVGDQISLFYILDQDINSLNGDKKLSISEDKNGYDKEFGIPQSNFGRGYLIIQKIDASGKKEEPIKYQNYLDGVTVGANTKVDVFEEGDYEVALDYEIKNDGFAFFDKHNDYRIRFKFSIRNGNSMVYPMDIATHSELTTSSIAPNGFYLDFANNKYLDVTIKKEILSNSADGLVEDTRFNRPAKSDEQYTEEGIYTITAKNKYTNETTTRKIYVGSNKIMKANVKTGYSIKDLNDMVNNYGVSIDDDGNIDNIPNQYKKLSNNKTIDNQNDTEEKSSTNPLSIIIPIVFAAILIFMIIKKNKNDEKFIKEKVNNKKNIDDDDDDDDEADIEDNDNQTTENKEINNFTEDEPENEVAKDEDKNLEKNRSDSTNKSNNKSHFEQSNESKDGTNHENKE